MKKGFVLVNEYYEAPSYLNQAVRLREELTKLGVACDVLKSGATGLRIENGKIAGDCLGYDFCVYLDKDKYLSLMLEKNGLRLFNRHQAICTCDDKMTTFVALSEQGLPMPETVSGLLCFLPDKNVSKAFLDNVESKLGYPLIAKESYGSLGKGVYKIDDRRKLERISEKLRLRPHLFQRYVASSFGKDIRVTVIGDRVVAAMLRRSNGDFRSNLELGGTGEPFLPDENLVSLSLKAAKVIGLDYCGIDWLIGPDGGPVLCEVNSNAFFGGIEKVTGANVAKAYAEHIIDSIYK